jgi:hypothetical protein
LLIKSGKRQKDSGQKNNQEEKRLVEHLFACHFFACHFFAFGDTQVQLAKTSRRYYKLLSSEVFVTLNERTRYGREFFQLLIAQ